LACEPTVPERVGHDRRVNEEIVGDGVVLRRWRSSHVEQLRSIVATSLTHIARFMPSAASEVQDPEAFLTLVDSAWKQATVFAYAIERDGTLVGHITCPGHRGGQIGCWIRVEETGRGLGTAALRALADAAFASNDDLWLLEARCDAANVASQRMLEKAGFDLISHRTRLPRTPAEADEEMVWQRTRR
jgi:RimJ/RimL family protein N-acetyltransferase